MTKKKNQYGGYNTSLPIEYFGSSSGRYYPDNSPHLIPQDHACGKTNAVSFPNTNLGPMPNHSGVQTGGEQITREVIAKTILYLQKNITKEKLDKILDILFEKEKDNSTEKKQKDISNNDIEKEQTDNSSKDTKKKQDTKKEKKENDIFDVVENTFTGVRDFFIPPKKKKKKSDGVVSDGFPDEEQQNKKNNNNSKKQQEQEEPTQLGGKDPYLKIHNPETNRYVRIYSKSGQKVLRNYILNLK